MTTRVGLKRQVVTTLDTFPEETLAEVAIFLDYLQYKSTRCLLLSTSSEAVMLWLRSIGIQPEPCATFLVR